MDSYFDALRRYFSFSGRSSRSQFWLYTLVLVILMIVAIVIDAAVGTEELDGGVGVIAALVWTFHLIPSITVSVRRLHDTDRSGWWVLIGLVPLLGQIALLVFMVIEPTGPNRFGPPVGQTTGAEPARNRPYEAAGAVEGPGGPQQLDQLEKLAALRASGAIDEAEFERLKAGVMKRSPA